MKNVKRPKGWTARKRWRDLSPVQKTGNIVGGIVELVLVALALWDISHRPESEINGKKRIWAMASFIQPIGPIIYFLFGRKKAGAGNGELLPA